LLLERMGGSKFVREVNVGGSSKRYSEEERGERKKIPKSRRYIRRERRGKETIIDIQLKNNLGGDRGKGSYKTETRETCVVRGMEQVNQKMTRKKRGLLGKDPEEKKGKVWRVGRSV